MNHEQLVKAAELAIDEVFTDTSVDRSTTKVEQERLQDQISTMLDTLQDA